MPVEIRPLRPADYADWCGLWTEYLNFYSTSLADDVFAATFARLTGDHPDLHGLVAVQDGVLVGLTHYIYHRHGWRIEDVCYLQDLYVSPDCRGCGAGRALIQAVYDAADANNTPSVYWLTQDDNAAGRQLYDRIGDLTNFIKYQRGAS